MSTCPRPFIDLAIRLADAGGAVARQHFRKTLAFEDKADLTPVTRADRQAEAAMRAILSAEVPDHGIVGEEGGQQDTDAAYVWVLDPIDGTKRFVTGNPLFGCLIALLHEDTPILGVIDMPVLKERWIGAAGLPTVKHDEGADSLSAVRACPGLGHAWLYATSPHMFIGDAFPAFERLRNAVKTSMYGGECFAYGLLASGFVDLVVEADMATYDYLALAPVVEGAGGIMTDWQGQRLTLNSGDKVIAAGDPKVHQAALAALAGEA